MVISHCVDYQGSSDKTTPDLDVKRIKCSFLATMLVLGAWSDLVLQGFGRVGILVLLPFCSHDNMVDLGQ